MIAHFFVCDVVKGSHEDFTCVDFWRSSHGRPFGIICLGRRGVIVEGEDQAHERSLDVEVVWRSNRLTNGQ